MKFLKVLTFLSLLWFISCDKNYYSRTDDRFSADYSGGNIAANQPGDVYEEYQENDFINVADEPVSTFSIDADGASYANVRRFLTVDNMIPPKGAIRSEELINYFDLDYPFESTSDPISLNGEVAQCPWRPANKLIRIGIEGKPIPENELPPSNYVFLIDVSGSMKSDDKLELLKSGFKLLVDELSDEDRIAIVTYAGSAGVVLPSTPGTDKQTIKAAIDDLGAGGSTAGAEGIVTAYEIAQDYFVAGGNNRIIMGTDGDFNVGISDKDQLVELIETKRDFGVFLTVLGVGRGNLNDAVLEQIANKGNGTYEYIDKVEQLKKVFIFEKNKFYTVAKDVKVQIEFNPNVVQAYRLIGYENRLLETEDFEDDTEDAGEIGANQNITALYEIVPQEGGDFLSAPTFTVDFRYKAPDSDTSVPLSLEIFDEGHSFEQSSDYFRFTSSVAYFSMLIYGSAYLDENSYEDVLTWLNSTNLPDQYGFKSEFKEMVERAKDL